jgi:hypothetical protein
MTGEIGAEIKFGNKIFVERITGFKINFRTKFIYQNIRNSIDWKNQVQVYIIFT